MSGRPKLLDLFCKAGGCAKGYQRAGFYVVGVDIEPQPRYCGDEFVVADALNPPFDLRDFDAIHASPPCQGYSVGTGFGNKRHVPRLIAAVRTMLECFGVPFVIENVFGAWREMRNPVALCGSMFGLRLERHRFFEVSFPCEQPLHTCHGRELDRDLVSVTAHGPPPRWYRRNPGKKFSCQTWKDAMQIDWMTRDELRDAIPPAYTDYIGQQLLKHLASVGATG